MTSCPKKKSPDDYLQNCPKIMRVIAYKFGKLRKRTNKESKRGKLIIELEAIQK